MLLQTKKSRIAVDSRRAVTFVEFVGCLAALGGGLVLGSLYLGVDVKAMAVGVLEQADIEVPEILSTAAREVSPKPEQVASEETETPTDEQQATEATEQTENAEPSSVATISEEPPREALSAAESQAATQAFWLVIDEAVQAETSHRSMPIGESQNWQLFDYLLHRQKGHQRVVETIELLDKHGVDQNVLAHTKQILTWHRAGAQLYERAAHLLTDAPGGKLTGPSAQSWQSAATQHRMEEKLLLKKHVALTSYVEHTLKNSNQ